MKSRESQTSKCKLYTKVPDSGAAGAWAKVTVGTGRRRCVKFGKGGKYALRGGKNFWWNDGREQGHEQGGNCDSRLCVKLRREERHCMQCVRRVRAIS